MRLKVLSCFRIIAVLLALLFSVSAFAGCADEVGSLTPEAATMKHLNGAENASDFMSYEQSILIFEALINHTK